MKIRLCWCLLACFSVVLAACDKAPDSPFKLQYTHQPPVAEIPVYHFAIHPLYNPQKLSMSYQPLMDYLNRHMVGARFELEASRDYQSYEQKYAQAGPDVLLPNPWQTTQAMHAGYHVIAMAGSKEDFRGIFIARNDVAISQPSDLRGKTVSYPSYTAIAACVMPQYYLHRHGLDVKRDIHNDYVGSQQSSIMNAYLGKAIVAVTWPPPWRAFQQSHPQEAAALRVVWETESLVNNSVMVRQDVPLAVQQQLQHLLLTLAQAPEGAAILSAMQTDAFYPADDGSYQVVTDYIKRFERDVRPVNQP